eukprot:203586-Prymnesium_polylepis.1
MAPPLPTPVPVRSHGVSCGVWGAKSAHSLFTDHARAPVPCVSNGHATTTADISWPRVSDVPTPAIALLSLLLQNLHRRRLRKASTAAKPSTAASAVAAAMTTLTMTAVGMSPDRAAVGPGPLTKPGPA